MTDKITLKDIDEAWESVIKNKPKEVKKVNKEYFSLKVVKVKKEKEPKLYTQYCTCPQMCEYQKLEENKKPKGNWVNGENLDEIKFPCFCSYQYFNNTVYAILSKALFSGSGGNLESYQYSLINIEGQDIISEEFLEYDLKKMIEKHDIHILKGKIIIFEEEE